MLVLTRRAGQAFEIGNDIEIRILRVDHKQIKIGITAPSTVKVLRSELKKRKNEKL